MKDSDNCCMYPMRLDNAERDMTNVKHRVGGYKPTLITTSNAKNKGSHRRKGSAKKYLNG